MSPTASFAALLERFFTQRLMAQRQVSSNAIASYRDTFRLLLEFVQKRLGKPPSALALADLDAPLIGAFLDDLEHNRGVIVRIRNLRLTADSDEVAQAFRDDLAHRSDMMSPSVLR